MSDAFEDMMLTIRELADENDPYRRDRSVIAALVGIAEILDGLHDTLRQRLPEPESPDDVDQKWLRVRPCLDSEAHTAHPWRHPGGQAWCLGVALSGGVPVTPEHTVAEPYPASEKQLYTGSARRWSPSSSTTP